MKKNIFIICAIGGIFFFVILFHIFSKNDIMEKIDLIKEGKLTQNYSDKEEICFKFIKEAMSSKNGGIHTNYLENPMTREMAGGHEILSESEGLIMLYYTRIQDQEEFDKHFYIVQNKMLHKSGLVKWRIREDNYDLASANATIDDLRIIRSLMYAYDIWKDKKYYRMMEKISNSLLKYNVYEGCLNNYFDAACKVQAQEIDLAYIDLYTIQVLSNTNKKWNKIYQKGIDIIHKGYISDKLPLYRKTYNIKKDRYIDQKTVNTIDTLLVVLHLSEIGMVKNETLKWIRDQMFYEGRIYAEYDIETGKPASMLESAATYAIAARIAKVTEDKALYRLLMDRMLTLQVTDISSPIYGGFGNPYTLKVYSFDNLQALLAF